MTTTSSTPIERCEGLHDAVHVIARLSEVVHHGAAAICENLLRVGAVK
jgi:hypothetical protein